MWGRSSRRDYGSREDELLRFAEAYDPQWFHVDREEGAHGRYGGLIASGWHTCSIAMRLAVDAVLRGPKRSDRRASPTSNG